MTTGKEILDRVIRLLDYTDTYGQADSLQFAEVYKRGLTALNQIYADLWFAERSDPFNELTTLDQSLDLSDRTIHDILPYGVAMLLAQGLGDGDNQALYASLYNQKRCSICRKSLRMDVLP